MLVKISFFILTFFYLFSCSMQESSIYFTNKEKEQFEDLFKNLMLAETGIYTLFGLKPITVISLDLFSQSTGEENREGYYTIEMKYCLMDSWNRWESKSQKLPIKNFLFFKRKIDLMENGYDGFFVNLVETKKILEQYNSIISEEVGFTFNPNEVMKELQDEDSKFWSAVFQTESHVSKGLLFGASLENAVHFKQMSPEELEGFMSDRLIAYDQISTQNFNIPFFRSYDADDPVIKRYQEAKLRICKYFEKHPFFEGVIQILLE